MGFSERVQADLHAIKGTDTIKMLDRALAVLDVLRTSRRPISASEIARICEITLASTDRILNTLESDNWATRCADRRFIISERLDFVIDKEPFFLALGEAALPAMEYCTETHGHAMNLVVRENAHCYVLQQSRTKNLVDYIPPLNADLPFYACASGKVLLSELPEQLLEQIFSSCEMVPLTRFTITDADVLRSELSRAAALGYAVDSKESAENGSCIAVPVRNCEGTIIAALSFSGLFGIEDPDELLPLFPVLQEVAAEISRRLYRCTQS